MIGIGVDIVSIPRMRETLSRSGNAFINKVFTENEQRDCLTHADRGIYYAKTFAAKEAVFKTFAIDWVDDMSFRDIEIKNGLHGGPLVAIHGAFEQYFGRKCAEKILLSISWEEDTAVAYAAMV
ncbi:MAG: holo-[acyl-carrier-protein] synthase [Treponema sp. GWC1_61_84]|nr:MAG: holo-[acyl-carrier-protein] synthase [Treponema sp. GWC1_61_84]